MSEVFKRLHSVKQIPLTNWLLFCNHLVNWIIMRSQPVNRKDGKHEVETLKSKVGGRKKKKNKATKEFLSRRKCSDAYL